MFIAYNPDRSRRYALPGAESTEATGAESVTGEWGRAEADAGRLRCADPHCIAPLNFRNGAADGSRRAHWTHPAGTAECAGSSSEMGAWHRFVQYGLLGRAYGHEHPVAGARVDVVVQRCGKANANRLTAIEAQFSPIDADSVKKRHKAHAAAGMTATLWLVPGSAAGFEDGDAAFLSDAEAVGSTPGRGVVGHEIRTRWLVDLIEACTSGPVALYKCTVGVLLDTPSGQVLRFIDRALVDEAEDGSQVAIVTSWTRPVREAVIREWAAGPSRTITQQDEPTLCILDMAPERLLKRPTNVFRARVDADRTRIRIAFESWDAATRDEGKALGLTWKQQPMDFSDGVSTRMGYLVGPATPAAIAFAERIGGRIDYAKPEVA